MEIYRALDLIRHRVKGGVAVRTEALRLCRQRNRLCANPAAWHDWDAFWKPSSAVHRYFLLQLQRAKLCRRQSVQTLLALDQPAMPPAWRYPDVVAHMTAAFDTAWPGASARINTLIRDNRIVPGKPPARCLYGKKGPRVVLPRTPADVGEIFRVAHETGHALDAMDRAEHGIPVPGPVLASEARAIQSELVLAAHLARNTVAEWRSLAGWWTDHRRRELWYYHRMLHRFECGLYELPETSRATVSDWWVRLNADFFGPAVAPESIDPDGWLQQMPLLITPLRFWCYPLAWHQARQTLPASRTGITQP